MLINIQFLRFAAATLVVLYHTSDHLRSVGFDQGSLFSVSEAIGFAGVDIFFVISGFIMAWTTGEAFGIQEAWLFFRRRLARIYSGYWPFFLIAVAVFAWANPAFLENAQLGRSAVLWPTNRLLVAVSWTLIFELYFYFCFTLLLAMSGKRRTLLLLLAMVAICTWATFSQFGRQAYAPGNLEYMSLAEYYMASPYMAEFIAGALVARWLIRHPQGLAWIWLIPGALLFLAGGRWNNSFFGGQIEQGYWVFYRVIVFGVPSLMILIGLVRLENTGLRTPLRFSLLTGGASYAIYLSHTLILTATQHMGFNRWLATYSPLFAQVGFALLAVAIIGYSVAHYRLLERPLHKVFLRITGTGG